MEVDEQAQRLLDGLEVRDYLRHVDREQRLDRLQPDHQPLADYEIQPGVADDVTLIVNGHRALSLKANAAKLELAAQRLFVDALQVTGSDGAMNLDGRSNRDVGEGVELRSGLYPIGVFTRFGVLAVHKPSSSAAVRQFPPLERKDA